MAWKIAEAGKTVLLAVHRQEIFLQTSEHLLSFGLHHNLIGSQEVCRMALLAAAKQSHLMMADMSVTLASLPTLMRRKRIPKVDYVFIDEAHHAAAKTWAKVIHAYRENGAKILGVTATPERHDGKPLSTLFDTLVMGPGMKDLIAHGFLAPFEIKEPKAQISRAGLHIVAGEFVGAEIAPRARVIVGDAISQYRKHMDGDKCLVFCSSVEEAERTASDFRDAGYRAASVDGKMKEIERGQRIRDLGNHTLQLLMSCNVLSEGLDVPSVRGMIHLRPTYSRGRWMQDVGRTLRFEPGKIAILLDHAGNRHFHGNPLDITDFDFAGKEQQKRGDQKAEQHVALRNCKNCFMPHRADQQRCPHCGHERETGAGISYQQVDGDLHDENRLVEPEIAAAMEVANIFASGNKVNGELLKVAKKHNLPEEWVDIMRARMDWWETPLGEQTIPKEN